MAVTTLPASLPLRIGISTRALFNLEEEHRVFNEQGVDAYAALQRAREGAILEPGTAFEAVRRLLSLNKTEKLVDVILLSRNSPDLSLRAFRSAQQHGLSIKRGSFTSGGSVAPYARAWGVDLFLSNEDSDVMAAMSDGLAAAKLAGLPEKCCTPDDEVRIAFDGDAVIFSDASDQVYKRERLEGFLAHEVENATVPMEHGPLTSFFHKLAEIRSRTARLDGSSPVRIALVTARNAPAHERVVHTLRAWGTPADEAHFVGPETKAGVLRAFGAHIFFDDQEKHVRDAAPFVAAGLVPGPHDPSSIIIPGSE